MTGESKAVIDLAKEALQANNEHLHALRVYTQKLEAELEIVDKLFDAVDTSDESSLDVGPSVTVPGSVKATTPITAKDLLSPESPFYNDSLKRSHYQRFTEVRPMKTKELEALAEAVQAECYRRHALDVQKRGLQAFPNVDAETTHVLGLNAEDIDWDRVADKVSTISMITRTARECEIRWLGEQYSEFNHGPWDPDEMLKVKSLVAESKDGQPDWVTVAKRLGTRRPPLDCMRHTTSRKLHRWTAEADERLLKAIRMYGHDNWHLVARYVSEDATPSQCNNRFQKTLDESVKRTGWSPEEDARLSAAVAAYGSSWVDIAASLPGRHNDQCRERWNEQLNTSINRGQWSEEEDKFLFDYVREQTTASWKEISERLGNGRTEAMCRSRYAALQKTANIAPAAPVVIPEVQVDQTAMPSNFASASSMTAAPPSIEQRHPNQLVFLEPVVGSNPTKPLSSHSTPRPKTTVEDDPQPSDATTAPPPKKRKTRPRTTKI